MEAPRALPGERGAPVERRGGPRAAPGRRGARAPAPAVRRAPPPRRRRAGRLPRGAFPSGRPWRRSAGGPARDGRSGWGTWTSGAPRSNALHRDALDARPKGWQESAFAPDAGAHQGVGCLSRAVTSSRRNSTMAITRNTLAARARDGAGKGSARRLRAQGLVPAVVYGRHLEAPVHIAVDPIEVKKAIATPH